MGKTSTESMKEKVFGRGLTPKVLITWLVLHIFVFTIVNIYAKGFLHTHTYITATRTGIPFIPPWGFYFLFAIITSLLSVAVGKRLLFSKQELAILFALMVMSLDVAILMDYDLSAQLWYRFVPTTKAVPANWIPSYFAPTDKVAVEATLLGNAVVPWGSLTPFLAHRIIYIMTWFAFVVFFIEILRKKYIEVDKLSYPGVRPSYEVIRLATEVPVVTSESKSSKTSSLSIFNIGLNKYFYIGFFTLGVIFGFPSVLAYTVPALGIPAFWCAGRFPVYPLADFFASNTWHIHGDSRWVPTDALMMYLLPMDVLSTLVLYQFVSYVVYPIIGTATGIMAPGVPGSRYDEAEGPFRPLAFSAWTLAGLGIWFAILSWRYLKDSLTAALKRVKVAEGDVPPLWAWAGTIISGLVLLVWGLSIGAPVEILIPMLTFFAIIYMGTAYQFGEGWPIPSYRATAMSYDFARNLGASIGVFPTAATATQASWATGTWIMMGYQWVDIGQSYATFPIVNYKLADMTETKPKEMFSAMLIAAVLIPLTSVPIAIWLHYTWGIEKILTWYGPKGVAGGAAMTDSLKGVTTPYPYRDPIYVGNAVASVIVTGVLMLARLRFAWFFINPIGIASTYIFRNMTEALPMLVIKYLTLKFGGAKAYDKIGVQIAVGALVGLTFWIGIGFIYLHITSASALYA